MGHSAGVSEANTCGASSFILSPACSAGDGLAELRAFVLVEAKMSRGQAIVAALLLLAASFATETARAATRTIVYIGARDCTVCHQWERSYQKELAAKCAARGVSFRSVEVETLRNIRDARYWPADLRPLL